ncbi:MAG: alpha/beta hydrolase [Myxococcales bacterium]|nr:alpha/beta hydrolase [Myxococcales bacterium]
MPSRRIPRLLAAALAIPCPACLEPPPPLPPDAAADEEDAATTPLVWEGRGPGDLYAEGEIRAFELYQGTTLIGRSWGRYLGAEGKGPQRRFRFETRTELLLPGRPPVRAEGLLVLDGAGNLVEGYERSEAVELRFARNGSVLRLSDGTREDEVLYEPERNDTAFMAHSAILHEELMLGLRRLEDGMMHWRVVSLSGGAPVEWEATLLQAPRRTGEEAVIRTNLGEEITLAGGRLLQSRVADSRLLVKAVSARWPSWTIEPPSTPSYEQADASFAIRELELPGRAGEPELSGELLIPEGIATPAPAVLWISSTGREDRHGFAGPPPVDLGSHEITDALARAGLVVLRFDERGQGRSEPGPLTFTDQLEDARRAFRTLLVQPEVDPDRVLLVAHGEGGLRALSLAAEQGKGVAGVALLGAPGRPYLEVLRDQAEASLSDVPPELREQAKAQQAKMLQGLKAGKVPPELRDHEGWLREVLELDPAKVMAKVHGPVWLAQGGKDFEVDPAKDTGALLSAARKRGKSSSAELATYEGLDHLFKPEPGRSTPSRYRETGRAVDASFLADLTAWAQAATRSRGKAAGKRGR